MKSYNLIQRTRAVILFSACLLCNAACINEIGTEVTEGDIPITFKAKVKSAPTTKVTNNLFDSGDKVGLYAMLSGTTIEQERYIDNLSLTCTDNNILTPQTPVFYPEGENASLDFIAYYPFQSEGVTAHNNLLPISIQTDQSQAGNYSASDFLIARKKNVKGSEDPVSLSFQHQLSNLKIVLTPGEGENIDEMLQASPRVIGIGFQTQADYNMTTGECTSKGEIHDIIPSGTWEKSDGKLTGKEFIVVPQAANNQVLQMEWNGRIYTCPLPDIESDFESNRQYEININATQSHSEILNSVSVTIEDWPEPTQQETENDEQNTAIHLAALSFDPSNVYHIHYNGKVIAEICLEYLKSADQSIQAIVAYPMHENASDLEKGTVLQVVGETDHVHGGSLKWDLSQNSYTYTAGSSPLIDKVHFDQEGNVLYEASENAVAVNILAYTLRDLRRGSDIKEYPIVKIGTQYWMRSNLQATSYRDGASLERSELQNGTPGYFTNDETAYFYSGEALQEGELAPEGWEIPTREDWEQLLSYVGNAAALKSGSWQKLSSEDVLQDVNNLSMFDIRSISIWHLEAINSEGKACGFWTVQSGTAELPEETVFFTGGNDGIQWDSTLTDNGEEEGSEMREEFYKALSIRCIKKE